MADWCSLFCGSPVETPSAIDDNAQRIKNTYNVLDAEERVRLRMQLGLTRASDVKCLKQITAGLEEINVLDIGCNDGVWIRDRISKLEKPCRVVGVEIDTAMAENAKTAFPEMIIINADAESEDFLDTVHKQVPNDVRFDLITLSMVLLHVKDVGKVLRNVRELLAPDGYLFIRDMNDELTVSSPDPEGIVRHMLEISDKVPYTGYRHNGAELYTDLRRCGYSRIQSIPDVVDVTTSIDGVTEYDIREHLFVTNFKYVKGDTDLACIANPDAFSADCEYVHENYEKLHRKFHETDYYYRMGTVLFVAQK